MTATSVIWRALMGPWCEGAEVPPPDDDRPMRRHPGPVTCCGRVRAWESLGPASDAWLHVYCETCLTHYVHPDTIAAMRRWNLARGR